MPQDGFSVFILSHVIFGKFNYPLITRFENEKDNIDSILMACAELNYWVNRNDIDLTDKKKSSKKPFEFLFKNRRDFVIECVWQSEHALTEIDYKTRINNSKIVN